jgi:hypothetical protein
MIFKGADFQDRQSNAAAAKKQLLEKFRAAANDPGLAERQAERAAIHEARLVREAEREKARKIREAELAAQAAREAELAAQAAREAEEVRKAAELAEAEAALALLAEQKATRDKRYAARKAAKKARRRGY